VGKYELLIKAVTVQGLSYGQVAARYGVSKTLVHKLHHRWLEEGEAAYQPRSRRPASSPTRAAEAVRDRVLALRDELVRMGLDAGCDTIHTQLLGEGHQVSRSTVWRILKRADRITPQPQKRPRSSYLRFAADRPNQMWQSDFTHWTLSTGAGVEIIGWLDDHARYLVHLTAHRRVSGKTVTDTFTSAGAEHGFPASTLTDNGMVYTTRYAGTVTGTGNPNAFETLLALYGITQKNGLPYKPTTQGKIERLWQTLKKHLTAHPVGSIEELQAVLDGFRDYYNTQRPHRAINRRTPAFAYELIPKASPTAPDDPNLWRVRYDRVDPGGKISLRYANRMLHLGIGRPHTGTDVIVLIHNHEATVIDADGTVLSEHRIDPERTYQRQTKNG
jgi:transposase InsO family protein